MKNKTIVLNLILLIIAIGNYLRISKMNSIRPVEFVSIFSIGILTGVLLTQIASLLKK